MNTKEELIIKKLFKLAENQQKILKKLAQTQPDPQENIEYLKRSWLTAIANTGISSPVSARVEHNPGTNNGSVQIGETYTIYAGGVPQNNDLRQKLLNNFRAQVKLQKPELDGKVGIIFN